MNEDFENFVPAHLIEPDALGDGTPPAPTEEPTPTAGLSAEEINRLVEERIAEMSGGGTPPPAPVEEEDSGETVKDYIDRAVAKIVAEKVGAFQQQFVPAQGAIAGEQVVQTLRGKYTLNAAEEAELRDILNGIAPEQRGLVLVNPKAQENLAAMAKGRASFKTPVTPAPSTTQATGPKFAPGVTEEDVQKYLRFQGRDKLNAEDIKLFKEHGYIK